MKSFEFIVDGIIFAGELKDNGNIHSSVDDNEGIYLSREAAMLLGASLLQIASEDDE